MFKGVSGPTFAKTWVQNNTQLLKRSFSHRIECHEEHLPRERFIESLATFAKNINYTLEADNCHHRLAVTLNDIRSFLARSQPPLYHTDDIVDCIKGGSSRRHLQSVKEEESEEVDDGSDGGEDRDDKLADGDTELVKRKPCKPSSKRSRRA